MPRTFAPPPGEEGNLKPPGRVYPTELAQIVDRSIQTIRVWEYKGELPMHLRAHRDSRGWRYWTPEQVDKIVEWIESRKPQSDEKLMKMRQVRNRSSPESERRREEV